MICELLLFKNPAPAEIIYKKQNQKHYEILSIYECVEK